MERYWQNGSAEDGSEMRTYPYGEVFAHVVGYDVNGKSGLESCNENLNLLTSNAFFVERIIKEFQAKKNTGDSVVTTLDANCRQQHTMHWEMKKVRLLSWRRIPGKYWRWFPSVL